MKKVFMKTDFLKVLLSAIVIEEGFNVRESLGEEDGSLETLSQQIATQGQLQPCKGVRRGDKIVLTAGHRRFAAILLANKNGANIERINVITEKANDEKRVFEMLTDGTGSRPLNNKEMVKGIERLLEMGVDKKDIVKNLGMGKSQAQAYNLVKAAEAPAIVKQMMEDGLISVAKVNSLQRQADNKNELVELAEEFVKNGKVPKSKVSADVAKLEEAYKLAIAGNPKSVKAAILKPIINKLKGKASAEDIASLLK